MGGIPSQNENSAAERRSAPNSMAPTMVAPERDTPGIMETHWAMPMTKYIGSENSVDSKWRGLRFMRSTHSRKKPPRMNMMQTMRTSNSFALTKPPNSAPITAAGRKA